MRSRLSALLPGHPAPPRPASSGSNEGGLSEMQARWSGPKLVVTSPHLDAKPYSLRPWHYPTRCMPAACQPPPLGTIQFRA